MPKNKKPAGGRPAQNFDPRYAKKSGGPFRGNDHRDGGPGRKPRWSRDDRDARSGEGRGSGERRFDRDERPRRFEDRGDRGPRRDDRRSENRGSGERRFDRGDRGPRRDDRRFEDRGRRFDRDDRPRRFEDRGDRGPRRDDRDDRPRRFEDRGDRGPRRDDRRFEDRGRRFDRDDRPRRFEDRGDRGPRRDDRDDRPRRFEDRGDRGPRRDDRRFEDRGRRFDRDDRPRRSDDRGPRRENAGERAWQDRREEQRPQRSAQQEQHIDVVHERLTAEAVAAEVTEGQSFGDLGLGDNIVRALAELGAPSPFPIQAATIAPIIAGKDVLARGRTGSGKTIAFGAPLVESILRGRVGKIRAYGRAPQALILAPTRELALQIDRTIQPIARSVGLFTTQVYGGVPQAKQVGALKKGVDIVIGTPGRIEDLQNQGKLDLSEVRIAVLDEADHMCELGFLEPVQRILRLTQAEGQKLLFSATLDREVSALVDEFLKDPQVYEVAGEDQDSGTIDHQVLVVDQRRKRDVIEQLVDRDGRTIVFTRTRAFADQLVEQLEDSDIRAIALHGDLNQARRTRNIERFSQGRIRVLVATDVAARGIHVDDVDLVVQADAPDEYKTYLHRSGRTGRAGREGRVVTLIPRNRRRRMNELLERAEIEAPFLDAEPGDAVIDEIAGAQLV
ncbi:DEAD/DEAH box helicase [Microbacterium sp. ZXX196]|uniref:DEAD/DEAH box helicase n=1 Tax=Microbacterium sp. ZXX196 TaxID=2609291 RepID=UPI0012B9E7F1|nr:DEAD/DEAH box helicase [Microbacterium sp. ZXX196]MTE23968.1 DEAD/DEAH box helicase [Microbacterium sp. ZXX196]